MLKKIAFRILSILLVCISIVGAAEMDIVSVEGFTHPEIAEFIIYQLDNHQPFFTMYDFIQYKIINPQKPYRGVTVASKKKATTLDVSLESIFNSYEGHGEEPVPVTFRYEGNLADYAYLLGELSTKDKIQAIKIIAGFEGKAAFAALKKIKGLEDLDTSYLEETYEEYTVKIGKKDYPYRVLMFHIEEEDWQESYFERYAYIKEGKKWKLIQIAKEYETGDYLERNKYIHGLAGNYRADYDAVVHDAMRGATWFTLQSELEAIENQSIQHNQMLVTDTSVFRLPANVTYTYNKKGWLSSIEYQLKSPKAFYSAFVSLYIRYYDPVSVTDHGMSWSLPDMQIELIFDDATPIIRFVPRINQEKLTAG